MTKLLIKTFIHSGVYLFDLRSPCIYHLIYPGPADDKDYRDEFGSSRFAPEE